MKVFKLSYLLLILLSSCHNTTDPMHKVQGVWLASDFSLDKASDVLLIRDSMFIYNSWGIYRYESPLILRDGKVVKLDPHGYDESTLVGKGDSLIQFNLYDSTIKKYYRADEDIDTTKLLYSDLLLQVALPLWSTAKENAIDLSDSVRVIANVSVGPLKRGEFGVQSLGARDSIYIQVDDMLIGKDGIRDYVHGELEMLPSIDHQKVTFVLHADTSVPPSFLEAIRKQINDVGCRVARAHWDDERHKVRFAEW